MGRPFLPLEKKFWKYVEKTDGCWLWRGAIKTDSGYGRVMDGKKPLYAHKVAYEWLVGPVPDGMVLDHLCRNRACVRPSHLETVTNRENILRGVGFTAKNIVKTHCQRGHAYTPENTYMQKGTRVCLSCRRMRARNRGRNERLHSGFRSGIAAIDAALRIAS